MHCRIDAKHLRMIACLLMLTTVSTGCRSGSTWNAWSWGKKPSPEALAGEGPSSTYPLPPSHSSNPTAIASVAGGTAEPNKTSQQLANNASPAATATNPQAAAPNYSAAAANGFADLAKQSQPATQTNASTASNPTPGSSGLAADKGSFGYAQAATASGYQFGGGTAQAASDPSATLSTASATSGITAPPSVSQTIAASNGGFSIPQGSAAAPANQSTGYSLPDDLVSNATKTAPATKDGPATVGWGLPEAAPAPVATTASAAASAEQPSAPSYRPGSTKNAASYPGGFDGSGAGSMMR